MASLSESEERYRAICELVHDWVYAIRFEPNDKVVRLWATYDFVDVCGFTSEEIDAMGGWVKVIHPEDRTVMEERVKVLRSGKPDTSEYRIVTKAGETRWLRDYGYAVNKDSDEEGVQVVYGAAQDITDHVLLEGMRREAHRMETIRQLAVTIKHEVNNALATIVGESQLLSLDSDSLTDDQAASARHISEAAMRITKDIEKLTNLEDAPLTKYAGKSDMVDLGKAKARKA